MSLKLQKVNDIYFKEVYVNSDGQLEKEKRAKVLLLDQYTMPVVSMSYTQSQLLEQDIVLIELINAQHKFKNMKHIQCIVFIKPANESIEGLIKELRNPHFSSYKIYLNNAFSKTQLEALAEADEFELVGQVKEVFQDFWTVNSNLFKVDIPHQSSNPAIEESNSLASLLLAFKKCPIIKYEPASLELKKLSSELLYNINSNSNNNLFDDINKNSENPPLLLLLDRKSDPITPLIAPWTYQSMIHEFIGISKNLVTAGNSKEQVTLAESLDNFFKETMYMNYGDLTDKFQGYVESYKKQTKQSSIGGPKTQNLAELKQMLSNFPEYRKLSGNILKHLNIISEIDKQIAAQQLWDIGELQQTIGSNLETQANLRNKMVEVLQSLGISTVNKVKLILLYLMRFPDATELSNFANYVNDAQYSNPTATVSQNNLIDKFNRLFNAVPVSNPPPSANNLSNLLGQKIKINQLFNSNREASHSDNVYMQYLPKLHDLLNTILFPENVQKKPTDFRLSTLVPDNVSAQYGKSADEFPVQDIIVYIKGGVTYEEARLVEELSVRNPNVNIVIGGDAILSSSLWLSHLYDLANDS